MTELREVRATADGVGIHYLRADPGTPDGGPPVLLFHRGIIDAARLSWGGVIEPLAAALDQPVIAPDFAGYGGSDRPVAAYSTAYHVETMRAFLNALGVSRVDCCGLSLGGGGWRWDWHSRTTASSGSWRWTASGWGRNSRAAASRGRSRRCRR